MRTFKPGRPPARTWGTTRSRTAVEQCQWTVAREAWSPTTYPSTTRHGHPCSTSSTRVEYLSIKDGQEPLVYLVTNVARVQAAGRPVVFSDGNAASVLSEFFHDSGELDGRIDWALMESRYWHNTLTHPDRMRRRMAEALVQDHVPVSAFTECVAMTDEAAAKVSSLFDQQGADMTVRVARDWYY